MINREINHQPLADEQMVLLYQTQEYFVAYFYLKAPFVFRMGLILLCIAVEARPRIVSTKLLAPNATPRPMHYAKL
jgi:hypothetical protein